MFYVYVLKSKDSGKPYIGFALDLRKRIKEHNDGKVFSTQNRLPVELIYYEAYADRKIANKRERQLKGGNAHIALMKRLGVKKVKSEIN